MWLPISSTALFQQLVREHGCAFAAHPTTHACSKRAWNAFVGTPFVHRHHQAGKGLSRQERFLPFIEGREPIFMVVVKSFNERRPRDAQCIDRIDRRIFLHSFFMGYHPIKIKEIDVVSFSISYFGHGLIVMIIDINIRGIKERELVLLFRPRTKFICPDERVIRDPKSD